MKHVRKVLNEFLKLLPEARFVTLDCEFSGIGEHSKVAKDLDSYLQALKSDASQFAMLQIGFCIVLYNNEDPDSPWSLYPYNLYTFPGDDEILSFSSTTLKWLKSNGFNFNRWVSEGLACRRMANDDQPDSIKKPKTTRKNAGLHKIIDAIITHRKPLVVHNGLLDIFHVYDKFIGSLPDDSEMIVNEFYRLFGFGVFDTKNVARYLYKECKYIYLSNRSLDSLYAELSPKFHFHNTTRLCESVCGLKYTKKGEPCILDTAHYHEAGFDATVTAMVFTAELSLLAEQEQTPIIDILDAIVDNHDKCGDHVRKLINCLNIHDPIDVSYLNLLGKQLGR